MCICMSCMSGLVPLMLVEDAVIVLAPEGRRRVRVRVGVRVSVRVRVWARGVRVIVEG